MIKVSIIVPVFNCEEYLISCLTSLLNQTLDDIEIIAIDDASEDNSLKILNAYEEKYPNKIKVLHNSKNYGQGYSRNLGMKYAKGKYITFVDSDDYIHSQMYEDMYKGAAKNNYPEIITTGLMFVKDDRYLNDDLSYTCRRQGRIFETLKNPSEILSQSPACWNKLYRADTLLNMQFLEGRMWEDVSFAYTLLFNSNKILVFNNIDYFYRKRADEGVSAKGFVLNPNLLDCFAVADDLEKRTKESGRYNIFQKEIKLIQATVCLQRALEVLNWDIPLENKQKICFLISQLFNQRYGNWEDVDLEILSSKVGTINIEKLQQINKLYKNYKSSSFQNELQNELDYLVQSQNKKHKK